MLLSELLEDVTPTQLKDVERFADKLWNKLGIDVEFTRHFIERMNDPRNGKDITSAELIRLFKKEYEKYGKAIKDEDEAVLVDLMTDVNLPFIIRGDKLVAKTVLRKKNFSSTNPMYKVS